MNKLTLFNYATCAIVITLLGGCAPKAVQPTGPVYEISDQKAEGVVDYIWEEPMVDVVNVPPGLDPEGHYYRPQHESVVEIKQGRWRYKGAE